MNVIALARMVAYALAHNVVDAYAESGRVVVISEAITRDRQRIEVVDVARTWNELRAILGY